MLTVALLVISDSFMIVAWYWYLKHPSAPIVQVTAISWLIAVGEYCFRVPANRFGYGSFTGYQLEIIQECIALTVFAIFAYLYLGEPLRWNYALSGICIVGAVVFAFWNRA
ncbi:MAG: DMT family protein [Candidatus Binataceae bacterium]